MCLLLLLKELEMVVLIEVEMFIIGVFGLVELHLKITKLLSDLLIASSVLKVCQFGNQFNNLLQNKEDHMPLKNFYLMNDMDLNFIH
jgi:hypothetical protein